MRDEVVLITGGSSGIGLAAGHRFAAEGARVILAARDPGRLQAAVDGVAAGGGRVRGLRVDVTVPRDVGAMADDITAREGRLDVVVCSAGELQVGPTEELGAGMAEHLIQVNYLGAVRVTHAALPLLRAGRRRSIVHVASLAAKLAPPFMAGYAGSKFALAGYTHALRQELRPEGFHVGLLAPGPVRTPLVVGKIRTPHYPLLPGVGILSAERTAEGLYRMVTRRKAEMVIPGRLALPVRFGAAFPRAVDAAYRRFVR